MSLDVSATSSLCRRPPPPDPCSIQSIKLAHATHSHPNEPQRHVSEMLGWGRECGALRREGCRGRRTVQFREACSEDSMDVQHCDNPSSCASTSSNACRPPTPETLLGFRDCGPQLGPRECQGPARTFCAVSATRRNSSLILMPRCSMVLRSAGARMENPIPISTRQLPS